MKKMQKEEIIYRIQSDWSRQCSGNWSTEKLWVTLIQKAVKWLLHFSALIWAKTCKAHTHSSKADLPQYEAN